jgi:hypothetical protein
MFGQDAGALLHRLLGVCAKAHVGRLQAAANPWLAKPGGPDDAGLPLNPQRGFKYHRHAPKRCAS